MRLIRMIAALASVAALAMAIRADEPKAAVPPELEWLPPNSAGFVHVRIHDLLSSPAGRKLIETAKAADPKAIDSVELGLGVPLSRIESVTLLVPTINARASEPAIVIRINTTKPYDRRDVRAALRARPIGEGLGDDSDLLKLEGRGVAHFSGERSLTLIPDEAGADGLLSQFLSHKPAGPLTAALQQAGGKSQIVAGVNVATLPRVPVEAFPPDLKPLRTLLDAKTLTITGTLADDKTEFAFRVSFGSKEDATEGNQAVTDGLKALQMLLAKAEMETKADSEETRAVKALMKEVLAGLKAAEVSQKDAEIVVAMRLESPASLSVLATQGTNLIRAGSFRTQSQNNLKQIGLAFHNYNDTYGGVLPANAIYNKSGMPLLSWRVAILPFVEQDNLYKQFHLDEPWDSHHNIKLVQQMPKVYALPGDTKKYQYPSTYYQAFVGPHAAFDGKTGLRFPASFPDGTSNTVWTAEAADAVPWTKPDDIVYDPKLMPKVGYHFGDRCNVGFADGSVRALKKSVPTNIWHLLIQRDDGNVIPNYDD